MSIICSIVINMKLKFFAFFLFVFAGLNSLQAQWKIDTTNVSNGFTGINFESNNIGYGTQASKVYKTTNAGHTWQTIKNSSYSFLEDVVATSEDSAFAFGTYSYIYFTHNSGQTWDSAFFDSTTSFLYAHAFSHNNIWFIGYRFDYTILYKTIDGGQTFSQDTIQGIIGCQDLEVAQNGRIYLAGMKVNFNARSIVFSDDQGLTWNTLNAVYANQVLDVEVFDKTIMHTGSFGNMYTSLDSGITFFDRSLSQSAAYTKIISDSLAFGFHSGSNYPKIFQSKNIGDTWQNVNIPFTGNISDVEQPYDNYPELIYLSVASYPYLYRYCDEVKLKLNSSLGYILTCGDTTQLNINEQFKTYWSNGDSTTQINLTNPGSYWVIGENICGNKDTINFQITQIPIPIKVSNDTVICEGDSVQLIAKGGNTYSWSPNFAISSTTDSTVFISPDSSISYAVLISDSGTQCYRGDTIYIDVISKAQIALDSLEICYADTVIIEADSINGYLYDWGFGSFPNIFKVGFLADTTFTNQLEVTSQFGTCSFFDSIYIEVLKPIGLPQKNFKITSGDTITDTLNIGLLSNITPTIDVLFNPGDSIVSFFPDSATIYILEMIDLSTGCTYFDTISIGIKNTFGLAPKSFIICSGDTIADTLMVGFLNSISPTSNVSFNSGNGIINYYPDTTTRYTLEMINLSSGLSYFDTTFITVDTNLISKVAGIAKTSSGANLQGGLAYMIGFNSLDSTVFSVDTSIISSNGAFTLQSNLPKYYIKVVPDSTLYQFEIPTYFSNGATFLQADSLVEQCGPQNIEISTLQGLNTGGSGFIAGNIYKGAGKANQEAFSNLPLLLTDTNYQILRFTSTDTAGYFQFKELPFGTYFIIGDDARLSNQKPSKLILNISNPNVLGGVFNIVDGSINLNFVQGFQKFNFKSTINVFPNPTSGKVWVISNQKINGLELYNVFGQKIEIPYRNFKNKLTIDFSQQINGVYFLRMKDEKGISNFKIIKE